jgi:RsiW-degrading membrane proteinase PrsW (M82 family)
VESSICPHCGSPVIAGDARCGACGAVLTRAGGHSEAIEATVLSPRPASAPIAMPPVTFGASSPETRPASPWPTTPPSVVTPPSGAPWPGAAFAMGTPSGAAPQPPAAPTQPGAQQPYPYPYPYPYGYPYGYGYPPYYYYAPPRPPRDTYGLVVAWLAIAGGIISLLGALVFAGLGALGLAVGTGDGLATIATLTGFTSMALVAGVLALVYGIGRVRKLPPHALSVPPGALFAGLALVALAAGVVLWNAFPLPGPTAEVLPLVLLSGVLPALAIVFYGARRLRLPTTTRHFWLSFAWGGTAAPLGALVLELVLGIAVAALFEALGIHVNGGITNINQTPSTTADAILLLITLSVIAPLAEEGLKPLGAVIIMRRLRSPGEAFLLGLAAGVGFDIIETIGYIGMNEADWVEVAIERIGAGLLHGVGAGMGALGWYYLINGKGVPNRWLKGLGGLLYAVLQHAIFNGSNLLTLYPPIGNVLGNHWTLGALPIDDETLLFFVYYAIILGVLTYVTGRLAHGQPSAPNSVPVEIASGAPSQALAGGA